MTEGTDAYLFALALYDHALRAPCDAREEDALAFQLVLRRQDAVGAEVVGMVVGHAQVVVAGIGQQVGIACRHAKRVAVGSRAFGALTAVAQRSLEVAQSQVGRPQYGLGIAKQLRALFLGQLDAGVGRTHHDVARHGDGQRVGGCCMAAQGKCKNDKMK